MRDHLSVDAGRTTPHGSLFATGFDVAWASTLAGMRGVVRATVVVVGMALLAAASCSSRAGGPTPAAGDVNAIAASPVSPAPSMITQTVTASPSRPAAATPVATLSVNRTSPTPAPAFTDCLADPVTDAFVTRLLTDLAARDPDRLAASMSDPFDIVIEATDVTIPPMSPSDAAHALLEGLDEPFDGYLPLPPGVEIRCVPDVTLEELTPGSQILEGQYTATILTTGWGSRDEDEEAILFLSDDGKGVLWWRAILYSLAGFER